MFIYKHKYNKKHIENKTRAQRSGAHAQRKTVESHNSALFFYIPEKFL